MSIKDRLLQYASVKNLTIAELERKSGLSRNSFANSKSMGSEAVSKILNSCPDLSAEWLMRGEGEMLKRPDAANAQSGRSNMMSGGELINTTTIDRSSHHNNYATGQGSNIEVQASSSEIVNLLKQQNATLTQQVATLTSQLSALTEVVNTLTKK